VGFGFSGQSRVGGAHLSAVQNISQTTGDHQLLRQYAVDGSAQAFRAIVDRYINLVHAAAVRQVGDRHLAEDVTQVVFMLLAQRAARLREGVILSGWLLLTTRQVAMNSQRHEWRLKRRERKVAAMTSEQTIDAVSDTAAAARISPVLDDAMARLSQSDRDVIVERFFRSKSNGEVAEQLGVNQQTAAKRISRALERLRASLQRHGVTTSDAALSAALPVLGTNPAAATSLPAVVQASAITAGAAPPAVAALASVVSAASARAAAVTALGSIAAVVVVGVGIWAAITRGSHLSAQASPPAPAAPAGSRPPAAVVSAATATTRVITLAMVDAQDAGKPIVGATVQAKVDNKMQSPAPADANGRFVILLPNQFTSLSAVVHAAGRVPMRVTFDNTTLRGDLPPEWPVRMDVGVAIGGSVVDADGKPVAGAVVKVQTPRNGAAMSDEPGPTLDDDSVVTAADGSWRIDHAPPLNQLMVGVEDPSKQHASVAQVVANEELVAKTNQITLPALELTAAGSVVDGVVYAPDGNPLAGVLVAAVAPNAGDAPGPTKTTTDAMGRFHLTGVKPDQTILSAVGNVGAPINVTMRADDVGKPIDIQLKQAATLQVLLVDASGNPVDGVLVGVEGVGWHWSKKTKGGGRAEWKNAPADEIEVFANPTWNHLPYAFVSKRVTAGDGVVKLVMPAALLISGRVTDAATHEVIPLFRLTYGVCQAGGEDEQIQWQIYNARSIANGRYEANIKDFAETGGKLRVEADGYEPAVSRVIKGDEGKVTVDFELTRTGAR
jgi:RNA polymerase sigma factor (sigma-70 family)